MRKLMAPLALAAVALTAPAAHADHRNTCVSSGSTTVHASKNARVFTKAATVRPRYRVRRYYGCMHRYNRKFRLATVGAPGVFSTSVEPIRLAGRFVGYGTFYEGPAGGTYAVVRVRDLRSGRQTAGVQAGSGDTEDEQGRIQDLELSSSGAVAWIESGFRVMKHEAGVTAVLDQGPTVNPRSLALSGNTLFWLNAGVPRSAPLGS